VQLGYLYGSFQGRINRKPFWWGTILLIVVMSVIGVGAVIMINPPLTPPVDPDDPQMRKFILLMQALSLISLYPGSAVSVKRLHDRNRSGWYLLLMYVPMFVKPVTDFIGITGDPDNLGPLDLALGAIIIIISIWFLIMLGFRRGTPGPNRFGPNPLGGTAPATAPGA
jgi:uncharacterized membrane protein YhaH (DUF805 family)